MSDQPGALVPVDRPVDRIDFAVGASLGLLAALLYRGTAPAVVNLDGLGYIKLIPHNFSAGHLLYMPLLRMTAALLRGNGLLAGRVANCVAGGVAITTAFGCARSLLPRAPSVLAAAGLAVSYGVWVQGSDVEAYAWALASLLGVLALALAYRRAPTPLSALALGLALGGAVLLHMTHVIVTPFVAAWAIAYAPSRRRAPALAAIAVGSGGALALGAYAWATLHVRRLDLAGAVRWVKTAGHGFPYGGGVIQRCGDAAHGLAKAFVWSPYLYESDAQTLLGQFLLGLAPLIVIAVLLVVGRRAVALLPWRLFAVWVAPYAGMALLFFGSDHERWVFVLPPLWLLAAAAVHSLRRRGPLVGAALVAYLAVANAHTAIGPARHWSWDRTRADAAAALMRDGDLVLFPGHSWDEYIGFYTHTRVEPLPIAYYLGRDGKEACLARLDREVRAARARGGRVFAVRLLDDEEDSRGFFELQQLGFPRPALRQLLARFHAVPLPTVEPKVTVWRLDERAVDEAPR
jgi:hypothetical protein